MPFRHVRAKVVGARAVRGVLRAFTLDTRGQSLRHHVLAVALAAALVMLAFTLFAERIYFAVLRLIGPMR